MTALLNGSAARVIHAEAGLDGAWRVGRDLNPMTLAHAPEWFAVIRDAYGHEPLYLTAEDDGGHRGMLPAFIVRRPFFGTVVASMPFLDTGGPCTSSTALARALVGRLMDEAHRIDADVVELRGTQRLDFPTPPMEHKVNLRLSLPSKADQLWRQLDGRVRNHIRKAERSGLSIEFGGAENLDDFYSIFATRMRELGSPVHARRFFGAIFDAFGSRARLALVRKGGAPIGGLFALAFRDVLAVPWASCLKEHSALCPNSLLYWETIRAGCTEGFRHFDFGRSSRGSGTYTFKRQWGAEEQPLFWYTIPIPPRHRTCSSSPGSGAMLLSSVWKHLPLSVTRRLGPPIRRYLTQ